MMSKLSILLSFLMFLVHSSFCEDKTLYVFNGLNARIPCGLRGLEEFPENGRETFINIDWSLPPTVAELNPKVSGGLLMIKNVSSNHNGVYSCTDGQYTQKFNLSVANIRKPTFDPFHISLPVNQCTVEKVTEYDLHLARSFCQTKEQCWVDIHSKGCPGNKDYKAKITLKVANDVIVNATSKPEEMFQNLLSLMNTNYKKSRQNIMQFIKNLDIPVKTSKDWLNPRWYMDIFQGDSLLGKAREDLARSVMHSWPDTITPKSPQGRCAPGYYVSGSGSLCFPCPPGHYSRGSKCHKCPRDKYQSHYARGKCQKCHGTVSMDKSTCHSGKKQKMSAVNLENSPQREKVVTKSIMEAAKETKSMNKSEKKEKMLETNREPQRLFHRDKVVKRSIGGIEETKSINRSGKKEKMLDTKRGIAPHRLFQREKLVKKSVLEGTEETQSLNKSGKKDIMSTVNRENTPQKVSDSQKVVKRSVSQATEETQSMNEMESNEDLLESVYGLLNSTEESPREDFTIEYIPYSGYEDLSVENTTYSWAESEEQNNSTTSSKTEGNNRKHPRGRNIYGFNSDKSKIDPTVVILSGILIALVATFTLIYVIRYRRKKALEPYRRILDDSNGDSGRNIKSGVSFSGKLSWKSSGNAGFGENQALVEMIEGDEVDLFTAPAKSKTLKQK